MGIGMKQVSFPVKTGITSKEFFLDSLPGLHLSLDTGERCILVQEAFDPVLKREQMVVLNLLSRHGA
jgi:hypothetical protein